MSTAHRPWTSSLRVSQWRSEFMWSPFIRHKKRTFSFTHHEDGGKIVAGVELLGGLPLSTVGLVEVQRRGQPFIGSEWLAFLCELDGQYVVRLEQPYRSTKHPDLSSVTVMNNRGYATEVEGLQALQAFIDELTSQDALRRASYEARKLAKEEARHADE